MKKRKFLPSLKSRIIIVLFSSAIVLIAFFIILSTTNALYTIKTKLYQNYNLYLESISDKLEKTINEMENISTNMRYYGGMLTEVQLLMQSDNTSEKQQYINSIKDKLVMFDFDSENIGLAAFLDKDGQATIAANKLMNPGEALSAKDVLLKTYPGNISCPHRTSVVNSYYSVISLYREVNLDANRSVVVYVESDDGVLDDIFSSKDGGLHENSLILAISDKSDKVLLTNSSILSIGDNYRDFANMNRPSFLKGYYSFEVNGTDFNVVGFLKSRDYLAIYMPTVLQLFIGLFLYAIVFIFMAYYLLRIVYHPIDNFIKEIDSMDIKHLYLPGKTKGNEFELIWNRINELRSHTKRLLMEVEKNSRENAELETELLMSRINPHFLHNVLGNFSIMLKTKDEPEIANMIDSLNKLLHYNLEGKKTTMLQEELQAVEDYLFLQRNNYKFTYECLFENPESKDEALAILLPHFILQTLVENSLRHGYKGEIEIKIRVKSNENNTIILISDTGSGIEIQKLSAIEESISGKEFWWKGIGIPYVYRSLKLMYGTRVNIAINSILNMGTEISIIISKNESREAENNDKRYSG